MQYQYFVKVVPTTYTSISGKTIASNQISVTEHRRGRFEIDRDFGSIGRLPGLFFFYEMSPIKVGLPLCACRS